MWPCVHSCAYRKLAFQSVLDIHTISHESKMICEAGLIAHTKMLSMQLWMQATMIVTMFFCIKISQIKFVAGTVCSLMLKAGIEHLSRVHP